MDGNRHLRLVVRDEDTIVATNRRGLELTIDPNGEHGFTPVELLMAALGACGAIDMAELMRKQRDPVTPFEIDVDGQKEDARMTWLRVTYRLSVEHDSAKAERAREKTEGELCTVSRTLTGGCEVTHVVAPDVP